MSLPTENNVNTGEVSFRNSAYIYEWKINNFFSHYDQLKKGAYLSSQKFSTLFNNTSETVIYTTKKLQWHLRVYIQDNKYISVYLVKSSPSDVVTKFKLEIVGVAGTNISKSVPQRCLFYESQEMWGWKDFIDIHSLLSKKSEFLVNNTLTISCSIYYEQIHSTNSVLQDNSNSMMLNYFEELFLNGDLSDVKLVIGQSFLVAHKNILSSLSPVFRAMFKNQILEQRVSVVNIIDIRIDVMHEFLRYIYTRKVNGIERIAADLFVAAHKYDVSGLKELCEQKLCSQVNANNAIKLMQLAVRYEMKSLKPKLVKLIASDLNEFMKKGEFSELSPDCKDELLSYMSNKAVIQHL